VLIEPGDGQDDQTSSNANEVAGRSSAKVEVEVEIEVPITSH